MANPIVRAVLLALVYIVVFILATPGLDGLPVRFLQTEQSIRRVSRDLPEWAVSALSTVSMINRDYRLPVVRKLTPIQRPLRIEQTWRLYGDGPRLVRRMEIRVDDEAIYRSGDPDLDWEVATWRNRRLRPIPVTLGERCRPGNQPVNRHGLTRLITERALVDYPEATTVEVRLLSGAYPGDVLLPTHGLVRNAPDWELTEVFYGDGRCR